MRPVRLAAAVVVAAIGCLTVFVASPTLASTPAKYCVGLFVDGSSIGGPRTSGCVHVAAGSTGTQVLQAADDTVVTEYNGDFVCSINDVPSTGCAGTDGTHYWSYWHRSLGSTQWSYSSVGAGAYVPVAGSTEGWVYDDGTKLSPVGVGQLCPVPAPLTSSGTPSARTVTPATKASAGATRSAPPATTAAATSPSVRASRTVAPKSKPATASPPPDRSEKAERSSGPKPSPSRAAQATPANASSGGSPWGLIAGLAIAGVLAGGAIWQSRRRRRL